MPRPLATATLAAVVLACSPTARAEEEAEAPPSYDWNAEVNLLTPFFPGGLFEARVLFRLWQAGDFRGEAFLGAHSDFSNTRRDTEGDRFDMGPQLGYRQYVWKGLHAELYMNAVYAEVHADLADGKNHASFVLLAGALAGYRFDLGERFYVMVQAGVAGRFFYSNPWPHPAGEGILPLGGLLLGVKF
jgi:opacity protein-like surface antigen